MKSEKTSIKTEKEKLKPLKIRAIRLTDENWGYLKSLKPRGKSWDLFIKDLGDAIKYFKNL